MCARQLSLQCTSDVTQISRCRETSQGNCESAILVCFITDWPRHRVSFRLEPAMRREMFADFIFKLDFFVPVHSSCPGYCTGFVPTSFATLG